MDVRYFQHQLIINQNIDEGFIGIITLWTYKELVYESLSEENKKKVLTVGNLYTTNGIEYIIRNVCLNPVYEKLVITGLDNNNVVSVLKKCEPIGDNTMNEYEKLFWDYFKDNIVYVNNCSEIDEVISNMHKSGKGWIHEKIVIPPPVKVSLSAYENERSGFSIRDSNLHRLWKRALLYVKLFGTDVEDTREIMNLSSTLTSEPKLHNEFPGVDTVEQYLPQVLGDTPTEGLTYTYGSRLHGRNQMKEIVDSLCEGIYRRNGVATTWEPPMDYHHPPPCLVLVSFKVQPLGKTNRETNDTNTYSLFMTTVFRSHDIYRAYPLNLYALWQLGVKVCDELKLRTNLNIHFTTLTNLSISAHVYTTNMNKLNELSRLTCNLDARGYFIIQLNRTEKTLTLIHFNYSNNEIQRWESNSTQELADKAQIFISEISHALYLGRELERAMYALTSGTEYTQP